MLRGITLAFSNKAHAPPFSRNHWGSLRVRGATPSIKKLFPRQAIPHSRIAAGLSRKMKNFSFSRIFTTLLFGLLALSLSAQEAPNVPNVTGLWCLSTKYSSTKDSTGVQNIYFGLAEKKNVSKEWILPPSSPGKDDRLAIQEGTQDYSTLVLSQTGAALSTRSWNVCVYSQKGDSATQELSFRLVQGELPTGVLLRFVNPKNEEVLFTWDATTPASTVLTCTVPVGDYRLDATPSTVFRKTTVELVLSQGWNLVANPLAVLESATLGDTPLLDAPKKPFHPGKQYSQLNSLEAWQGGEALWIYADSPTTLTLSGKMPEGDASTLADGNSTNSWRFAGLTAALDKTSGETLSATTQLPEGTRAWDPARNNFATATGLPTIGNGYLLK